MKRVSKLMLILLAVALVLPLQGFAGAQKEAKKPVAANPKPVYTPPTGCTVNAMSVADANKKRKKIHADRRAKGQHQGPKVTYNQDAAKRHGKHHAKKG